MCFYPKEDLSVDHPVWLCLPLMEALFFISLFSKIRKSSLRNSKWLTAGCEVIIQWNQTPNLAVRTPDLPTPPSKPQTQLWGPWTSPYFASASSALLAEMLNRKEGAFFLFLRNLFISLNSVLFNKFLIPPKMSPYQKGLCKRKHTNTHIDTHTPFIYIYMKRSLLRSIK